MAKVVTFPFEHGTRVKVKTAGGGLAVGDIGNIVEQYQTPDAAAKWVSVVQVPIETFGNHRFHVEAASLEKEVP